MKVWVVFSRDGLFGGVFSTRSKASAYVNVQGRDWFRITQVLVDKLVTSGVSADFPGPARRARGAKARG